MRGNVCVVGAGIIGMSTAVYIQQQIRNVQVTVVADAFSPNTTSDMAAGLIEPIYCNDDPTKIKKWCKVTMDYIREHMKNHPNDGAQEMSGYMFTNSSTETPYWAELMDNFRRLNQAEVAAKHHKPQKVGYFYTTLYMEPTKQLMFLTRKFLENGGKLMKRRLETLSDLGSEWDVIVNCTGLGASRICEDSKTRPLRGQIMRVKAEGVKHFFVDDNYYALLNDDCIILGGTKDLDEWDTVVDETTAAQILKGNSENVPSLQGCKVISHHVGLRPSRDIVRLEKEHIRIGDKQVSVVHNYGHGGSGITLFWGCAKDATDIVLDTLPLSSKL